MDKLHLDQHISQQFNMELEELRKQVMMMGGRVEAMVSNALKAVIDGNSELAQSVTDEDDEINDIEKDIDEQCNLILARRQPAASDLRLIISILKTITDLERIGDEAEHIAKMAMSLADRERPASNYRELENMGSQVRSNAIGRPSPRRRRSRRITFWPSVSRCTATLAGGDSGARCSTSDDALRPACAMSCAKSVSRTSPCAARRSFTNEPSPCRR